MNKKNSLLVAIVFLVGIAIGFGVYQVRKLNTTTETPLPEDVGTTDAVSAFAGLEYMALALEQLESATSYQGEFHNILSSKNTEGELEEVTTDAIISIVLEPFTIGMQEYTDYGDVEQISSIYLEEGAVVDGEQLINTYMNYGKGRSDEWTEMTVSQEGATRFYDIYDGLDNMILLMQEGTGWEEISNVDGVITVAGNIPAEKAFSVVHEGNFFKLGGMSGIDEAYFVDVDALPVKLSIAEDGTPLGYELDLTRSLNFVVQAVTEQLYSGGLLELPVIQEYYITQTVNVLNALKEVAIPEEAKEAINYEEEIVLMAENEEPVADTAVDAWVEMAEEAAAAGAETTAEEAPVEETVE